MEKKNNKTTSNSKNCPSEMSTTTVLIYNKITTMNEISKILSRARHRIRRNQNRPTVYVLKATTFNTTFSTAQKLNYH